MRTNTLFITVSFFKLCHNKLELDIFLGELAFIATKFLFKHKRLTDNNLKVDIYRLRKSYLFK